MKTDYRCRLDAILDVALSVPDEERELFLEERCVGDAGLRADVDLLLRLAFDPAPALQPGILPEGLLRSALADAGARAPIETQRFGTWRVVREIGRGGMGAVYFAERADGQFEQRGALKLVRSSVSSDAAQRFKRERRILASLNHANIARLLDGGQTEDGQPYFVMEFVEGRSIVRFCDEERVSIDDRLDMFMRVCSAVHYAHGQLIVHRDIKPSNIVVTTDGEVKLLDFGIARLLSSSESDGDDPLTRPMMRILTPEYASPEQVRGEPAAITSDVYQLGLLLYELLTGCCAQAVPHTTPAALERAVCETPSIRPSVRVASASSDAAAGHVPQATLARTLKGDLDAIVLCALRKEPARRYATAGDLCEDVRRYRTGHPVSARGDSFRYRNRKFVRRHRVALGWSAALLIGLGAAVPTWTGQRWRVAQEAARAQQIHATFRATTHPSDRTARRWTPGCCSALERRRSARSRRGRRASAGDRASRRCPARCS
jgi:serine/threonine protein kinase